MFHKMQSNFGSRPMALLNVPQHPWPFWLKTLGFAQCSTKYILGQDPWLCSMINKIHSHVGSRPLALFNVPQNPSPSWLKTPGQAWPRPGLAITRPGLGQAWPGLLSQYGFGRGGTLNTAKGLGQKRLWILRNIEQSQGS